MYFNSVALFFILTWTFQREGILTKLHLIPDLCQDFFFTEVSTQKGCPSYDGGCNSGKSISNISCLVLLCQSRIVFSVECRTVFVGQKSLLWWFTVHFLSRSFVIFAHPFGIVPQFLSLMDNKYMKLIQNKCIYIHYYNFII